MGFAKKGLRKNIVDKRKKVNFHLKGFYRSVGQMNELSQHLIETVKEEITEDNINEIVKPILGRELDSMEKFLVLSKLHIEKSDEETDNIK